MSYMVRGLRHAISEGEAKYLANPNLPGKPGIEDALTMYLSEADQAGWTLAHTLETEGDTLLVMYLPKPDDA